MTFVKTLRTLAAALTVLVVLGASLSPAAFAVPGKGNPAMGKPLFASKCVACHKPDGSGGVKLTGNPTPNWKDPRTWADPKRKASDDYLRDCITNGKIKSGMVAWGKTGQLKPAQIEDVIAYVNTLAKRK